MAASILTWPPASGHGEYIYIYIYLKASPLPPAPAGWLAGLLLFGEPVLLAASGQFPGHLDCIPEVKPVSNYIVY